MFFLFPSQLLRFASFQPKPWAVLLAAGLAAGFAPPALAQKYRTTAGIRAGGSAYGLTVQQLVLPSTTLEGLALFSTRERSATVLAERHFGILGPSLNYYLGAGAHVGSHKDHGTFWGFDGIVGAEYKIPFARVVLSVDFKPTVEFNSADWTRFPTAFSVRYILVKQKKESVKGFFERMKNKIKGSDSE
ncbi:hypothetical protein [Hymenobacter sp. IS2118]|uniref:hypothetical protein n=1 Tax=Hymenobacter sp. IS2118 TaxID=1505605 RepID=UPI00068B1704|nr:hypothetical protein [Hymenobacter sp. IS2118]